MDDLTAAARTLARFARLLEHACSDLSLAQYRVLATVADGDERASKLAGRLALAKPTITAVVDGLVERGLLRREAIAGDRRAVRLALTAAGRRALTATERALALRLKSVFAELDDPDGAASALADLQRALDSVITARMNAGARS